MEELSLAHRRMAVFIDAENLLIASQSAGFHLPLSELMRAIRAMDGIISFARAYGDWSKPPCSYHLRDFRENVIELTQLSTSAIGKNTADIALAVDAMEMVLSAHSPEVFILAAADRDYVPLVQKAKRYGKVVVGIGVRGSVSRELAQVCDRFLMLDDLIPESAAEEEVAIVGEAPAPGHEPQPDVAPSDAAPSPAATASPAPGKLDLTGAFELLRRVVAGQKDEGLDPLGGRTLERMRQLVPDFRIADYGYDSFRDFALAAQQRGLVRVIPSLGGDLQLDLPAPRADTTPDLRFGTPEDACESYRLILAREKRVPIVPYRQRHELVAHLWEVLGAEPDGLTIAEMGDLLKHYAFQQGFDWPDRAYEKIVHTLNIAHCFEASDGYIGYFNDLFSTRLRPAVPLEEAIAAMHHTYIMGIRLSAPSLPLVPEGLALLLLGEQSPEALTVVKRLLERFGRPADTLGQRIQQAMARQTNP